MAFFRSLGVRVLGMIDDYMWAERKEKMPSVIAAVKTVLPALGWSFNAKCVWEPADEVLMLGMLVNTKDFVVKAPEKKIRAAVSVIDTLLKKVESGTSGRHCHLRELQVIAGRLMSMMLALPAVRVFTRDIYTEIAKAMEVVEIAYRNGERPNSQAQVTLKVEEELRFWSQRLLTHNQKPIDCREEQVEMVLWCDASDVGWGGEVAGVKAGSALKSDNSAASSTGTGTTLLSQPDSTIESMQYGSLPYHTIAGSSTLRELQALIELSSTPTVLQAVSGRRVKIVMDSIPALRNLINGGGPKPHLTELVKTWTKFCEQHNIEPVYEWAPREENWRADKASKLAHEQHQWKHKYVEIGIRNKFTMHESTKWNQAAHRWGSVPVFKPHFHQVDARLEMIRAHLVEAILLVPDWPAGGRHDWYRRVQEHSVASIDVGTAGDNYSDTPRAGGARTKLRAYWIIGRRGDKKRAAHINTDNNINAGTNVNNM